MCTEQVIDNLSDENTVTLAQAGNSQAMEQIIARYKPLVQSTSSKFYMNGLDNDDIIQEGMIGLYRAIIDYKPGKSAFKTFAVLCITRRIISVLKATKRQKHIPLNSSLSLDNELYQNSDNFLIDLIEDTHKKNPESIIISEENLKQYKKIISNTLSALEYKVFTYHLHGHSYSDIAKIINKDIKSVDNAIQRIKKKLLCIVDEC